MARLVLKPPRLSAEVRCESKVVGSGPNSLPLRLAVLLLAAVFNCQWGTAQTQAPEDRRILHQFWTFQDGAPSARALAQTADGYLWLGTVSGLFRFDGIRFDLFRPAPGDAFLANDISTLFAPATGGLWIGYRSGGFSLLKNGRLTNFKPSPSSAVFSFAQDRRGVVWAAVGGTGVWRFDGSSWQKFPAGWPTGMPAAQVGFDRDGGLWALTDDRGARNERQLFYLPPGGAKFRQAADHVLAIGFTRDADQTVLTTSAPIPGEHTSRLEMGEGSLRGYPILKKDSDQILDRSGGIWFIPRDPFILRYPAGEPLAEAVSKASPRNSIVYDVNPNRYSRFVDREGNMWVGDGIGLHRFSYTPLIEPQLPKDRGTAFTVAPDDGGVVWISNGSARSSYLYWVTRHRVELRSIQEGVPKFAYRAPDKTLWFGSREGIIQIVNGRIQHIRLLPEMAPWTINLLAITQDSSGGIWVSFGTPGLYRLKDGAWTKFGGRSDLRTGCLVAFTDRAGRTWFGFSQNEIRILDHDRVQVFGPADGLEVGNVKALYGRGPDIWVGGEFGLEHFEQGRFRAIHSVNPESLRGISGIVETANGDLWLNGLGGIIHLRRAEIMEALKNPAVEVRGERFGRREGVPGLPAQFALGPTAVEGTDGRLWFTAEHGVVWLDPARASKNATSLPATIESVSADDRSYALDSPIRFPAHTSSVQISYAAVSLSDPEAIHFRYKLGETDKNWHEGPPSNAVSYFNLAPGSYDFIVSASDTNGLWSGKPAVLHFTVLPAYYQTSWFRALCAATFLALLWAAYQLRVRQLAHEFNVRLEERVGERTRIARDLHDTLLQSFHGVLLFLQSGIHLLDEHPAEAKKTLNTAAKQAERAIIEGREAVQGLRTSTVERNDLALAIKTLGGELATADSNAQRPEFNVQVEGIPRDLHPILRDEVYRIAGEAMRNAFRHADAKQIEVEIRYDERQLRVRVRDDGKGIDPKLLSDDGREGHFGLRGMRERAKLIGGKLTVWSELDSGTEVELGIPSSRAYTTADGQRSWLAEKFAKFSGKDTD